MMYLEANIVYCIVSYFFELIKYVILLIYYIPHLISLP